MAVVSNEYVVITFNHFSYRFNKGKWKKIKRKKVRKDLIQNQTEVQIVQGHYQYHHRDRYRDKISQLESNNIITTGLDALKEIKHITEKDNRYKLLPFGTVRAIRELKLIGRNKRIKRWLTWNLLIHT